MLRRPIETTTSIDENHSEGVVPSQNPIRAENGTILPPCSVKNLNSTMSLYEERETLSVSACARGVYKGWVERWFRIRPPDRNDDAARRVAREKECDPKLRKESCG